MHDILSVSDLNRAARTLLESQFSMIWVAGEISNLAMPRSGHQYFSLKDKDAQIRCAMFRSRTQLLDFTPSNGQQVIARGRISLYEARGEYQLVVEHLSPAGEGVLQLAFEQLKQRLFNEGLFAAQHKQALPALAQRIGVITSPTGAALRDVLSVLKRRFPAIPVRIYPLPVQGKDAPAALIAALQHANQRQDCDVLLLTRGGGSLEDLSAFNDEGVARAIFASQIPLVSAIGHEIDFSIADFVADQRAATPSAAAELLSPDSRAWLQHIQALQQRLQQQLQQRLDNYQQRLHMLRRRLRHPRQQLEALTQRLDYLHMRLQQIFQQQQQQRWQQLHELQQRLQQQSPAQRLPALQQQQQHLYHRLQRATHNQLQRQQQRLAALLLQLDTLSPLATLQRGYAIAQRADNAQILRQADQVKCGDQIHARLAQGTLLCRVEAIETV